MFGLPKHLALTAVLIVMLFQIVAVMLLPTDGFWINDDALKTIQIKTIKTKTIAHQKQS